MNSQPKTTAEIEELARSLGLHTFLVEGQTCIIGRSNIEQIKAVYSDSAAFDIIMSNVTARIAFNPSSDNSDSV